MKYIIYNVERERERDATNEKVLIVKRKFLNLEYYVTRKLLNSKC